MMQTTLVDEGLKFMVLGMGTVFSFLGILVLLIVLMSKFFSICCVEHLAKTSEVSSQSDEKKKKVAAIMGAIIAYKKSQHLG